MFYQLPPVGNPIRLSQADQTEALLQTLGDTYQAHYFASGTASLAAAITTAIQLKAVDEPEVILPAYGCPDLISAAVFAGAKPVLVDIEADRPWMDLEQLPTKISKNTVAIIAVNLFGISERMEQLRPLAEQAGALLIEDSAQAFPGAGEQDIWQGDLVVLSFGRGKPLSLLGGGAVLFRNEIPDNLLPETVTPVDTGVWKQISFKLKVILYNWMINPRLYWLPQALPFLHLGETRYHALTSINAMDRAQLSILSANLKTYCNDKMSTQKNLMEILKKANLEDCGITDLARACKIPKNRRLLRYPLLMESELRDSLYTRLQDAGLGPSQMYPAALPEIPGLESLLSDQGDFPEATSFAKRLLTLPTHQQVSQADIDKISRLISR